MPIFKPKSVWIRGEDEGARLMKKLGCKILARNLRLPIGEIDILCRDQSTGTIIIVEVKAREHTPGARTRIDPTANITNAKQGKLRTLAHAIKKRPEYRGAPIRIDVIAVVFEKGKRWAIEIKHYPSAVADR